MYVDLKYLKYLPLDQFTDKGGRSFNFRCPVCGDSRKSTTKKRGWAFEHQNQIFIKCYNCGYANSLRGFIKNEYPMYYDDYVKEKFADKKPAPKKQSMKDLFASEYDSLNLQKINDLPKEHKAVKYLRGRMITPEMSNTFYYSDNFSKWLNIDIEKDAINYQAKLDRRIVIPFFTQHKKIFAIQGRSIDNADPKYITFKMDKGADKIYGMNHVDFTKPVLVVEGPLDSLFLNNCLACAGSLSDIEAILKYTPKENITIVPDNDKRNFQTKMFIEKAIAAEFKVVVWNKNIEFKDINDAVEKGYTKEEILGIIEINTYSGLMATTKFKLKGI